MAERIKWADVPIVYIPPRPTVHCPGCRHHRHTFVRSEATGDGTVTRKMICNRCSEPFKIGIDPELPIYGNGEFDPAIMEP